MPLASCDEGTSAAKNFGGYLIAAIVILMTVGTYKFLIWHKKQLNAQVTLAAQLKDEGHEGVNDDDHDTGCSMGDLPNPAPGPNSTLL